jgi:hypothetical protein
MHQIGCPVTDDDVKAMMKSVGVGPLGKISFTGDKEITHNYV